MQGLSVQNREIQNGFKGLTWSWAWCKSEKRSIWGRIFLGGLLWQLAQQPPGDVFPGKAVGSGHQELDMEKRGRGKKGTFWYIDIKRKGISITLKCPCIPIEFTPATFISLTLFASTWKVFRACWIGNLRSYGRWQGRFQASMVPTCQKQIPFTLKKFKC